MGNGNFLKAVENSVKALKHVSYCDDVYSDATKNIVNKSFILDNGIYETEDIYDAINDYLNNHTNKSAPDIHFIPCDTVSTLFDPSLPKFKFTVLNFASFKHPGGMFLQGSSAQEESLCHESNLYSILRDFEKINNYYSLNKERTNRSMYSNRAIFSPNVIFERKDQKRKYADVITCAAPNFSSGYKLGITDTENSKYMNHRVKFLFESLIYTYGIKYVKNEDRILILGAWGCGVFGQNPYEVSQIFRNYIELGYADEFKKVVFSILPGKNFDEFVKGYTTREK